MIERLHVACTNIAFTFIYVTRNITSQWPRWRLKSPASRLFTQSFIRAQIKENIKAPRHWPLCGEFTGTGEFPAQRASNAENASIWWRHHVDQCCTYRCPAPISVNSTADPVLIIGWCIDGTNFRWISRIVIKVIWLIHSKQQGHSFTYMD